MKNNTLFVLDFDKTLTSVDSINFFVMKTFDLKDKCIFYLYAFMKILRIQSPVVFKQNIIKLLCKEKYQSELSANIFFENFRDCRSLLMDICTYSKADCIVISATPKYILEYLLKDVLRDNFSIHGGHSDFFYGPDKVFALKDFLQSSRGGYNFIVGLGDSRSDICLAEVCDVFFLVKSSGIVECYENKKNLY